MIDAETSKRTWHARTDAIFTRFVGRGCQYTVSDLAVNETGDDCRESVHAYPERLSFEVRVVEHFHILQ